MRSGRTTKICRTFLRICTKAPRAGCPGSLFLRGGGGAKKARIRPSGGPGEAQIRPGGRTAAAHPPGGIGGGAPMGRRSIPQGGFRRGRGCAMLCTDQMPRRPPRAPPLPAGSGPLRTHGRQLSQGRPSVRACGGSSLRLARSISHKHNIKMTHRLSLTGGVSFVLARAGARGGRGRNRSPGAITAPAGGGGPAGRGARAPAVSPAGPRRRGLF